MSRRQSEPADSGYTLERDARIPNTLRVPARAAVLAYLYRESALVPLLEAMETALGSFPQAPPFVLGAGSNILFTQDIHSGVLCMANRGISVLDETAGKARVRIGAGELWDSVVRWALAQGYAGLENLILIPGTAGAAPIQNIGAYGVELSEFVAAVRVWDRQHERFAELGREACEFDYRHSLFKRHPGRYLVTALDLELPRERGLQRAYRGVDAELAALGVHNPGHADLAHAVERLRRRKLPDPAEIGNAGSFFKNPVFDAADAQALKERHPALPIYPSGSGEQMKLSAAWLIEACGFKGYREGDVGVAAQHALVLVNYGQASGADIVVLAQRIRNAVLKRFGVTLEPEPRIV